MKKLMFAIAAVAAGTVLADVTSANIVGDTNKDTAQGFQGAGFSFVTMSEKGKLGDLGITGYTGEYKKTGIYLCKLDEFGFTQENYYWKDFEGYWDLDDDDEPTIWVDGKYGWYTKAGVCVNKTVTIDPGEAIWFCSPDDKTYINWPTPIPAAK